MDCICQVKVGVFDYVEDMFYVLVDYGFGYYICNCVFVCGFGFEVDKDVFIFDFEWVDFLIVVFMFFGWFFGQRIEVLVMLWIVDLVFVVCVFFD